MKSKYIADANSCKTVIYNFIYIDGKKFLIKYQFGGLPFKSKKY